MRLHSSAFCLSDRAPYSVFYGLHTGDVLEKYKRLIIGQIKGESPKMYIRAAGDLSLVPHAEPTWLSKGYYSPYYSDSHRALQKAAREFYESYVKPEAIEGEATGERVSQELLKRMGSEGVELTAMRMGPGKHLHGKKLLGGVDGAEYDYFVCIRSHGVTRTQLIPDAARTCHRARDGKNRRSFAWLPGRSARRNVSYSRSVSTSVGSRAPLAGGSV